MTLNEKLKALAFDKRLIDWNLRHGIVKRDEVKSYLSSLEDVSANATAMKIEEDSPAQEESFHQQSDSNMQFGDGGNSGGNSNGGFNSFGMN